MSWSIWLYVAAWSAFTGCLLLYGLGSPWWTSVTGRTQLSLYASLVAVLSLVLTVRFLPLPLWLVGVLRVLFLGSVAIAGVAHFVNILRLQHHRRCQPASSCSPAAPSLDRSSP